MGGGLADLKITVSGKNCRKSDMKHVDLSFYILWALGLGKNSDLSPSILALELKKIPISSPIY